MDDIITPLNKAKTFAKIPKQDTMNSPGVSPIIPNLQLKSEQKLAFNKLKDINEEKEAAEKTERKEDSVRKVQILDAS